MSVYDPQLFVQQFALNVQLLLQQKGSKLRNSVMSGSHVGKQASPVDQINTLEMNDVTSRYTSIGRSDAETDRRWVYPTDSDLNQLVDNFDKLKMIIDPTSSYVQTAIYAAGRKHDNLIIAALNGTNQTGETAQNAISVPSTQKVAVNFGASANTGLTVAKLREARRIHMSNNLDMESEEFFIAVKAKQHDNLLAEAQVVSTDFNDKPVLVEGRITRFLGFNFLHTELLTQNGSSQDLIPCYAKSGVYLGIWKDMVTDVAQRKDLTGLPWQIYLMMSAGATRLEEKKVVQITCA